MIDALSTLMKLNILLALVSLAILALYKMHLGGAAKQLIVRIALTTALVAPIVSHVASQIFAPSNIFAPPVQIGATSAAPLKATVILSTPKPVTFAPTTQSLNYAALALLAFTLIAAIARLATLIRDKRRLAQISDDALTLREIRNVKIQISPTTQTPFAARYKRQALIVIPQMLVGSDALDTAIRHELQHHRQNDLQWNMLLEATRLIAGWNPLVRTALERIEEIDELACDENLLGRGLIDVKRYALCLFEAAVANQTKRMHEAKLAGTARMATSPNFLKRRIEMTLQRPKQNKVKTAVLAATIALTTATAAWASEGLIKDRRVTQAEAQAMASKLHVPINKRVLKFLNLATGTPRSRFYMRNALKRMKQYKPMIEAKLAKENLPQDLLALPLMESGYQNTETSTSAGLWQFIPETARKYGLVVDDTVDERLDANKETEAAVTYLAHLQSMFQGDLMLSLLSYNAGESTVNNWIAKSGERDVFKLADDGVITSEENANYDAKYIASVIVMNNPSLVAE